MYKQRSFGVLVWLLALQLLDGVHWILFVYGQAGARACLQCKATKLDTTLIETFCLEIMHALTCRLKYDTHKMYLNFLFIL